MDQASPLYVADFCISSCKNGSEKAFEGDQITRCGVYFVSASLPGNKLTDFYGSAAYPLSYPNEWDRKQGRLQPRHCEPRSGVAIQRFWRRDA